MSNPQRACKGNERVATRRRVLIGAGLAVTVGLTEACHPASPLGALAKDARDQLPEPIEHHRWADATHGYLMVSAGVLAPGLIEVDRDRPIFRWWKDIILPEHALAEGVPYTLRGTGGLAAAERLSIGRPVVPPVYRLNLPVLRPGDSPTRIGYADVGIAHFFPWRWIRVDLEGMAPEFRANLVDLDEAIWARSRVHREVHVFEAWTPPGEVARAKELAGQPDAKDPIPGHLRDVIRVGPPVSVGVEFDFDREKL